jgi:DNA-binding Lrp family transcriptional regulator
MTSKKRKYGDLSARPLPSEDPSLLDDVFAAFTGPRPTIAKEPPQPRPNPKTSPVTETSLISETRLSTQPSLVKTEAHGLSETRLSPEPSLVVENTPNADSIADYASSIDYGRGHSRIYHEFADKVLPLLSAAEQLLYIHLDRYREGGSSTTIPVSWPTLEKRSGLSQSTLIRAARSLEEKGLIRKVSLKLGRGRDQGNRFWVFSVTSLISEKRLVTETRLVTGTPIKDKDLKENTKRKNELSLDTKNCPDCQGSGFWYPEGNEKGVAKCKHQRLKREGN